MTFIIENLMRQIIYSDIKQMKRAVKLNYSKKNQYMFIQSFFKNSYLKLDLR
jgi:hypothetical protein